MEDRKRYIEYKDLLQTIKRRKLIIFLLIIGIMVSAHIYRAYLKDPIYEAKASLIIGNPIDIEKDQFEIESVKNIQVYMQTYVMIFKTNTVAENTIKKLKLDISIEDLKKRIQAIPHSNTQFMEIRLNWGNQQDAALILDNLLEEFILEATKIYPTYSIKVLEKASPYLLEPLGDKLYYTMAFVASLLVCILVVLLFQFFDDTIVTEEDVEKYLSLPVMGTIPKHNISKEETILDHINRYDSYILDAYRILRTNLYYYSKKNDIKTIVITSASPKEGKTTAAAMLAMVLAKGGSKTLLIDCDMRNGVIYKIFNTRRVGISNVLMGDAELSKVLIKTDTENLFIVPAGIKPYNPVELLSSDLMKKVIADLRESFDYIILDTPPVGFFTEAQVLSQSIDGYLLVVASGESDRELTIKAQKLIHYTEGKMIGVLLNKS